MWSPAFLKIGRRALAFHIFKNLRLFYQKIVAGLKLPVEIGRWEKIPYNQRICPKCPKRTLGDEYHYLLECDYYKQSREKYIKRYYYLHPNVLKFNELMNNLNLKTARNLSMMLREIIDDFENDYRTQFTNRWQQ